MQRVVVIDDDPLVHVLVRGLLADDPVELHCAETAESGRALIEQHRPDAVLLDILLPDQSGLELFRAIHAADARLPVVVITTQGTSDLAIQTMREGAYDFLAKPLDRAELHDRVHRALAQRQVTRQAFEVRDTSELKLGSGEFLIGRSGVMRAVYKEIGRLAAQDSADVLICGETGCGKELVARTITHYSGRADQPFLIIPCTGAREADIEQFLAGETPRKPSPNEVRGAGTWFFDEIADLSLAMQAKMVQFLQNRPKEAVPGRPPTAVRVLAATRCDLQAQVRAGKFRPDLFFQLQTFQISLPPLRERLEDLEALCWHFVKQFNPILGKRIYHVAQSLVDLLQQRPWPGNVRELQNFLKKGMVRATGAVLTPDCFEFQESPGGAAPPPNAATPAPASAPALGVVTDWSRFVDEQVAQGSQKIYEEAQELMERQIITHLLRKTQGNQAQAAQFLGVTRTMLRNRIRMLGIQIERHTQVSPERETA